MCSAWTIYNITTTLKCFFLHHHHQWFANYPIGVMFVTIIKTTATTAHFLCVVLVASPSVWILWSSPVSKSRPSWVWQFTLRALLEIISHFWLEWHFNSVHKNVFLNGLPKIYQKIKHILRINSYKRYLGNWSIFENTGWLSLKGYRHIYIVDLTN